MAFECFFRRCSAGNFRRHGLWRQVFARRVKSLDIWELGLHRPARQRLAEVFVRRLTSALSAFITTHRHLIVAGTLAAVGVDELLTRLNRHQPIALLTGELGSLRLTGAITSGGFLFGRSYSGLFQVMMPAAVIREFAGSAVLG